MLKQEHIINLKKKAEQYRIAHLTAKSFMETKVITIHKESIIKSAIKKLSDNRISGLSVVDDNNKLYGIISEYDLLLQAASNELSAPIKYKKKVITGIHSSTLKELLILLFKNRIKRIPIIDQNKRVIGIVSRINILKKLISKSQ